MRLMYTTWPEDAVGMHPSLISSGLGGLRAVETDRAAPGGTWNPLRFGKS
jgi:hypothetical protein